ncbi:XdhC family protein [Bacillus toyonensis]|uniref:XdhC family protein n=1 Tax=Bacillus toyonensis TaxID=155322 RepID=UPI001443F005|nr:XdhC/CoxI family protein [Bacillus toyonensis]MBH0358316.1 hypothetical protein [Bacillus toyonensis biovar Thuringiensis]NKW97355.1 hypothetical protein [Bacillus toyonensis]
METIEKLLSETIKGRKTVLATVINTKGSTYRKQGAQMVINDKGIGYSQLSGGCIENNIIDKSLDVMNNQTDLDIGSYLNLSQPDPIFGFDKGCKGDMDILILDTKQLQPYLHTIYNSLNKNEMVLIGTIINHIDFRLVGQSFIKYENSDMKILNKSGLIDTKIKEALKNVEIKTGLYHDEKNKTDIFIQAFYPQKEIIVMGAGNDVFPILEIAKKLNFELRINDFRESLIKRFTNRCKEVNLLSNNIENVESYLKNMSKNTPVVIMSHNFSFDCLCLKSAINLGFKYIGVMGPRHRLNNLMTEIDSTETDSIRCPIGINIAAQTPEEIAISILGEIINYYNDQTNTWR